MARADMRIAELAERAGISVRNVRFYHQVGILPRPELRGRVGWYDEEHLARLRLVRRLQERGYSLAAIADAVASQVPAVLAEEAEHDDSGATVWDGADPGRVELAELTRLVPGLAEAPQVLDELVALGLLKPDGPESFTVLQPPLLRAGILLVARGVPLPTALTELRRLQLDLGGIAERFAQIVDQDMLPAPSENGQVPPEVAVDLVRDVWPAVLIAVGQVLTDVTQRAVLRRLSESSGVDS